MVGAATVDKYEILAPGAQSPLGWLFCLLEGETVHTMPLLETPYQASRCFSDPVQQTPPPWLGPGLSLA